MQYKQPNSERMPLIRHAIVFQLKLGLDALRDVLMSPISIVLVVTDIILAHNSKQSYFLKLMRIGRKSDHWINLFGVNLPSAETEDKNDTADSNVDDWFSKIEEVIKEQQVDGKLSQLGKEKLQQYYRRMNQPKDLPEDEGKAN
jgi:hypothetical protein